MDSETFKQRLLSWSEDELLKYRAHDGNDIVGEKHWRHVHAGNGVYLAVNAMRNVTLRAHAHVDPGWPTWEKAQKEWGVPPSQGLPGGPAVPALYVGKGSPPRVALRFEWKLTGGLTEARLNAAQEAIGRYLAWLNRETRQLRQGA